MRNRTPATVHAAVRSVCCSARKGKSARCLNLRRSADQKLLRPTATLNRPQLPLSERQVRCSLRWCVRVSAQLLGHRAS